MGANTGIEYVQHSINFWTGCSPISAGCDNCFAARGMRRWGRDPHERRRVAASTIQATLRKAKPGDYIFVNSWSDFFDTEVPANWGREAEDVMLSRPDLIFLVLTKRIEEFAWVHDEEPAHVWLGVTAENQERFDERWPLLSSIDWPGRKWLSYEPALGPLQLGHYAPGWVVCGCESGPNARPMKTEWARSLRDQCVAAGVPYFLKQLTVDGKLVKMPKLDGKVWDERPSAGSANLNCPCWQRRSHDHHRP